MNNIYSRRKKDFLERAGPKLDPKGMAEFRKASWRREALEGGNFTQEATSDKHLSQLHLGGWEQITGYGGGGLGS
jgi:hypothetical protein